MIKSIILALACQLFASCVALAQYLNLGFETSSHFKPALWSTIENGYKISSDTVLFFSGHRGLRIDSVGSGKFGSVFQSIPWSLIAGRKKIKFTAGLKCSNLKGHADIFIRADKRNALFKYVSSKREGNQSLDWRKEHLELEIDSTVVNVVVGCTYVGSASAWFDDLMLEFDGTKFQDENLTPIMSEEQKDELKRVALKFNYINFSHNEENVLGVISKNRIIGIGEATHGTHEFYKLKQFLIEELVTKKGFQLLAIEANLHETKALNGYIQNGKGDLNHLIRNMAYPIWRTKELYELVASLRQIVKSGRGSVQLIGYDAQDPFNSIDTILSFIKKFDKEYLPATQEAYSIISVLLKANFSHDVKITKRELNSFLSLSERIISHLEENENNYLRKTSVETVNMIRQSARLVSQAINLNLINDSYARYVYRDSCLATNIRWAIQNNAEKKMIVSGHNMHISKDGLNMGNYLNSIPGGYFPIALAFNEGEYSIVGTDNLSFKIVQAAKPYAGSVEWYLKFFGDQDFFLNLNIVSKSHPLDQLFSSDLDLRTIGATPVKNEFYKQNLMRGFDGIFFINRTSASMMLEKSN